MPPDRPPSLATISTQADEQLLVSSHGHEAIMLTVNEPHFGSLATVRLDAAQAAELAATLTGHVEARRT